MNEDDKNLPREDISEIRVTPVPDQIDVGQDTPESLVTIPKEDYPEKVRDLQEKFGLVKVTKSYIDQIGPVGDMVRDAGSVKLVQGSLMMSQSAALQVMDKLRKAIAVSDDEEAIAKMSRVLGYLSGAISRTGKVILEAAELSHEEEKHKRKSQSASYVPGAVIQINVQTKGDANVEIEEKEAKEANEGAPDDASGDDVAG